MATAAVAGDVNMVKLCLSRPPVRKEPDIAVRFGPSSAFYASNALVYAIYQSRTPADPDESKDDKKDKDKEKETDSEKPKAKPEVQIEVVRALVEGKSDVNHALVETNTTRNRRSPLMHAISLGKEWMIKALLDLGADAGMVGHKGRVVDYHLPNAKPAYVSCMKLVHKYYAVLLLCVDASVFTRVCAESADRAAGHRTHA